MRPVNVRSFPVKLKKLSRTDGNNKTAEVKIVIRNKPKRMISHLPRPLKESFSLMFDEKY